VPAEDQDPEGVAVLIDDVCKLRRVALDRLLQPLKLKLPQWRMLIFLAGRDGMTQRAMAAALGTTCVTVGSLLASLEDAGLVRRQGDAADARIRRSYLTGAGRQLVTETDARIERFERESGLANSSEDLAIVVRTLTQMKRHLHSQLEAAP
jgi:DNA-binding MarR family transcriptional regulator